MLTNDLVLMTVKSLKVRRWEMIRVYKHFSRILWTNMVISGRNQRWLRATLTMKATALYGLLLHGEILPHCKKLYIKLSHLLLLMNIAKYMFILDMSLHVIYSRYDYFTIHRMDLSVLIGITKLALKV